MSNNARSNTHIKEIIIKDFYDFTFIVQQYYKMLQRYTRIVIPFKTEAEEIVSQVMLNLWNERKTFHSQEAIRSFLKKHTRRQCMNWLYYKTLHLKKTIPNH